MKDKMNVNAARHFLRAGILLGFTGLIAKLSVTGEILLYIAPHLVLYAELAAAGLFIASVFELYISVLSLKQPVVVCDCGHEPDSDHLHDHGASRSIWRNTVVYGLFILPLAFAALVPSTMLAGSLVQTKGMHLGRAASIKNTAPEDLIQVEGNEDPDLKQMFKTDKYNRDYAKLAMRLYKQDLIEMKDEWFIEKMQALETFVDRFVGKEIKMKGFIYREPGLPEFQFIVARMAMTHCIADVSPYGFIAESPDAGQYADDSWVTIMGTIGITDYRGRPVLKIDINRVEPEQAPEGTPYVYPDWDFASKL